MVTESLIAPIFPKHGAWRASYPDDEVLDDEDSVDEPSMQATAPKMWARLWLESYPGSAPVLTQGYFLVVARKPLHSYAAFEMNLFRRVASLHQGIAWLAPELITRLSQ